LAHEIVTKFGMGDALLPEYFPEDKYGNPLYG